MFRAGYILNPWADTFWFLLLPFLATLIALATQQWLTSVAIASISLWITFPHHFASWLRTYGIAEDRQRWYDQLIIGPVVILGLVLAGLRWAPVTAALLLLLWDHQHSLMQQHGFARIYDFKAHSGGPATGRFDLALAWILFGNMLLTSPLLMPVVIRELYRFHWPVTPQQIQAVQLASWIATGLFLILYFGHLVQIVRQGHKINPIKYLFIFSSYFLWYFCAWQTANILVFGVAHRIMHGLQYSVFVYWYLRKHAQKTDSSPGLVSWLVQPGHVLFFIGTGLVYAFLFHVLTGGGLIPWGFGLLHFPDLYRAIPAFSWPSLSSNEGYALISAAMIEAFALTHYYFDSFIWKVSDRRTQAGLA